MTGLRDRKKQAARNRIISAATSLFSTRGLDATTMDDIADAAEVSVGTVYFYFKNKEDLIVQLMDEIGFQLRNRLGEEYKQADGSIDGFKRAGQVFFEEFCPRYPQKIAILFRESAGQSSHVEKHRKQIFEKMIGDVEEIDSWAPPRQDWLDGTDHYLREEIE